MSHKCNGNSTPSSFHGLEKKIDQGVLTVHRRRFFFENLEFQSSYDSQQISTAEFRLKHGLRIHIHNDIFLFCWKMCADMVLQECC